MPANHGFGCNRPAHDGSGSVRRRLIKGLQELAKFEQDPMLGMRMPGDSDTAIGGPATHHRRNQSHKKRSAISKREIGVVCFAQVAAALNTHLQNTYAARGADTR
jgi:hypothetical protein